MIIVMVIVFLLFDVLTQGRMHYAQNLSNLLLQNAYVVVLACGMLLCILTGGNIDLSVGAIVCMVGALGAKMLSTTSIPAVAVILICLVLGTVIGVFQGYMREIREKDSKVIIIILTAYDKFDYAKDALSLGAFDFLTKPVSKSAIIDVVTRAAGQIEKEKEEKILNLRMREKLETVVPIIESGYISSVILQNDESDESVHYRELLNIQQENGYALLIRFGEELKNGVLTNSVGMNVRAQQFYTEMREIIKERYNCYVGPVMEKTPLPDDVVYVPGLKELEETVAGKELGKRFFGGLPIQIGYCNGHNKLLNAVEYHRNSEINIAMTDMIVMFKAGRKANELGHIVLLDPVGAGASRLRTDTAKKLLKEIRFDAVRGNISEIKALCLGTGGTHGVDAAAVDAVTEETLDQAVQFVKEAAAGFGCIAAVTGAIDLVSDGKSCYVIRNGRPEMSGITGTGCQLSALMTACLTANPDRKLEAAAAAVCAMGLAGEIGHKAMRGICVSAADAA